MYDSNIYRYAAREIIHPVQRFNLTCHFQDCAGALFGFETGMRRAPARFDREHACPLAPCFDAAAAGRGLKHQHGSRSTRFCFNQSASAQAPCLFVARQQ